jgi:tripeptide aminopeptidase
MITMPKYFCCGHNFHGKYEYVPVESIKAVEVIVKIRVDDNETLV